MTPSYYILTAQFDTLALAAEVIFDHSLKNTPAVRSLGNEDNLHTIHITMFGLTWRHKMNTSGPNFEIIEKPEVEHFIKIRDQIKQAKSVFFRRLLDTPEVQVRYLNNILYNEYKYIIHLFPNLPATVFSIETADGEGLYVFPENISIYSDKRRELVFEFLKSTKNGACYTNV